MESLAKHIEVLRTIEAPQAFVMVWLAAATISPGILIIALYRPDLVTSNV